MRTITLLAALAIGALAPIESAGAQVAGEARLGVTIEEMRLVVLGWTAKRDLLDKPMYNDRNERIGELEDVVVSPNRQVSWAIVDVEGFLGIDERRVAIPMDQIRLQNTRLTLPGATKDKLRSMPPFVYAK